MSATPQSTVSTLVQFSRLLSDVTAPAEIFPMLAAAAQEQLEADGAAALSVTPDGALSMAAARGLPEPFSRWHAPAETIGPELGEQLLVAGGGFARSHTWPLVSGGDLFGALVLLFRAPVTPAGEELEIVTALVDLAAISLGKAFQLSELSRSYAELRASRDAMERSEKLRALGQMAAGVSHDLKNILNPLLLQVQQLRRRAERGQEMGPVLERMERVLRQGVENVERLRNFSRQAPDELPAEPIDINELVPEVAELCGPRMRLASLTGLQQELGRPPPALLRPGEFVSAILNLVVNSLDALGSAGLQDGTVTMRTGEADGGAFIEVADNGPGLPPEIKARLFEPFLTTKGEEGTGLGLAMVYAFVQRHRGTITVETKPGEGTRFRLWFPAVS